MRCFNLFKKTTSVVKLLTLETNPRLLGALSSGDLRVWMVSLIQCSEHGIKHNASFLCHTASKFQNLISDSVPNIYISETLLYTCKQCRIHKSIIKHSALKPIALFCTDNLPISG